MKRILATDFDGTIYFHDRKQAYNPEDMEAILRFQRKGNLVGINSGRCIHHMENVEPAKCPIRFDFYCGDTGSMLADSNRNIIQGWPMNWQIVEKYLSQPVDGAERIISADGDYFQLQAREKHFPVHQISSLEQIRHLTPYSFSLEFFDIDETRRHKEAVFAHTDELTVVQNWNSLDCVRKDRNKGEIFLELARWANVSVDRIAAIGDGLNDLEAIQAAGTGFAMNWAPAEVKEAADYTVDSVSEAIAILEELDQNPGQTHLEIQEKRGNQE